MGSKHTIEYGARCAGVARIAGSVLGYNRDPLIIPKRRLR